LNTYKTNIAARADQETLRALYEALCACPNALRRDVCGAWRISGEHGHIYSCGDGKTWLVFVTASSARRWSSVKKRLVFCQVTQNGDDEGCFRLLALPIFSQAAALRKALGIRKRPVYSPEVLEKKRRMLASLPGARGARQNRGFATRGGQNPSLSDLNSSLRRTDNFSANMPIRRDEKIGNESVRRGC
jgi:hypothetical protein